MKAALAAPHTAALDAARATGGNALDLALAAATTLVVAYPHQCALGGDLIALVRLPGEPVRAVLSAGAAPVGVDVAAIRETHDVMPGQGPHSVTVPGIAAGWAELAALGATVPLASHLRAAAALAENGLPVAKDLARAIARRAGAIQADPGLRAVFGSLREGDTLRHPALAATLRTVADEGIAAIYGGGIGAKLVAFLQGAGSAMSLDDFASHEVQVTEPLVAEAFGATWHVAPPPAQGATLLAMLGDAPLTLGRARAANAARDRHLGDPHAGPVDVEALCAPAVPLGSSSVPAAGDTIAIAAVDEEGRAVTLIQSLFQHFGAGMLEPSTGVTLHNRGGGFTLEEGHPGVLAPGARPPHTLCPSMIFAGDAIIAAGCQGGRAQPQILAQVAPDLADPASDLQAALARPRWIVAAADGGRSGETVLAEPGADAPETEAAASGVAFERLAEPTGMAGHVQAARLRPDGLAAGSDPRADGGVLLT